MALEVRLRATGPIPLDVAFRAEAGEVLALVGPSGSGKTTVLRSIAGLWHPQEARIAAGGTTWLDTGARVNRTAHRRRLGVVFQTYALFPHMSAVRNVMAAMDRADEYEARRLLYLVNLHGLETRRPAQLSGGQQQRVFLARALVQDAEIYFMDEPFQGVDVTTEKAIINILKELKSRGKTVVVVHHDLQTVSEYFDWLTFLNVRKIADGSVADTYNERNLELTYGAKLTVAP